MINYRRYFQAIADGVAWAFAVVFATLMRFDFDFGVVSWSQVLAIAVIAGALQVLAGYFLSLYRGRYRFGSFDEVFGVVLSCGLVAISLGVAVLTQDVRPVPRGAIIVAGPLALCLMLGSRFLVRAWRQRRRRPDHTSQMVLVFGAGEAAEQLIRSMKADPRTPYWPVGMLDDDPDKRRLRIHGVPVLGTRVDVAKLARRTGAESLIVGIARADAKLLRELAEICGAANVEIMVLPPVTELTHATVGVEDVRGLDEMDLLGRQQVHTDIDSIAHFILGRRVLVTGAGGSIGSELARQIHKFGPEALGLLDRDESALHAVELAISGSGLLTDENMILADIRDPQRMREVFKRFRPDVVFHAAALKHLPLLEQYPAEAAKTNVVGTLNVLEAAAESGVRTFVNISTDKAADPCSVLGFSKRATERLTAEFASMTARPYVSVRFGNVLGSRGSVLTSFRAQIAAGGPVTVTHPDVTRYFMTIPEAVQLVLQAAAIGAGGEVMVLDMGAPVQIDSVARRMIERSGKRIEIRYTGLRPGEKLHEDLFSTGETAEPTAHDLIEKVHSERLSISRVSDLALDGEPQQLRNTLVSLAGILHGTEEKAGVRTIQL